MKVSKTHLNVFVALLLFSSAHAQQLLDTPTNKSKTIVVSLDSIAPADAYRKVAQLFMDGGYALTKTDNSLYYLTTDWGDKKGFWLIQYSFSANVRASGNGSQVRLTGQVRQPNNTPDTKTLMGGDFNVNNIEKRTNMGKYWKDMEALAVQLGGSIKYL